MKRLLAVVCVLAASPASAQRVEIVPLTMAALTSAAKIENKTLGIYQLEIDGGFTYGAQFAYLISTHTAVEAWWTWQDTGMKLGTPTSAAILYYMDVSQIDTNFVYTLGPVTQRLRPYVFGGVGVTSMTAAGMDTDSAFAWNVGAGVKYFPYRHIGVRFDARYKPAQLNTSSAAYCAPHSFCQTSLRPFQIGTGMVLRF